MGIRYHMLWYKDAKDKIERACRKKLNMLANIKFRIHLICMTNLEL